MALLKCVPSSLGPPGSQKLEHHPSPLFIRVSIAGLGALLAREPSENTHTQGPLVSKCQKISSLSVFIRGPIIGSGALTVGGS